MLAFAALVYFLVRLLDDRHGRKSSWGPAVRRQREQRRTVAPDDDDQFLRDLERKRRALESEIAARRAEFEAEQDELRMIISQGQAAAEAERHDREEMARSRRAGRRPRRVS